MLCNKELWQFSAHANAAIICVRRSNSEIDCTECENLKSIQKQFIYNIPRWACRWIYNKESVRSTTNKLIDGLQFSACARHSLALENILQSLFNEKHDNRNEINKIGHTRVEE